MNNKRPIAWHKDCLENMRRHAQSLRESANRINADAARTEAECILRDSQIIEAEMRGVTKFDYEKFGIKRGKR